MKRRSTIYLRSANQKDWKFIKDLAAEAFSHFGPYRRIVSGWLTDRFVRTYLLEHNGKPAGFFMLGLMLPSFLVWTVELMAIAVVPEKRRQGFGQFMIIEAEKIASMRGYRFLRAHVGCQNESALKLFQKVGFKLKRYLPKYYPSGLDAYELIKRL